jgi:hypothetical protein
MSADESSEIEVPDGAAVFPHIPAELGVDPLLLAVLHATVFLAASTEDVVHPAAADEAIQSMAEYLQRLEGARLLKVREDLACLAGYGRQEKWPKQLIRYLKSFLADYGLETEEKA